MIIGADCSISTEPIAELAPFWNLVQVCTMSCLSPFVIELMAYVCLLVMTWLGMTAVVVKVANTFWCRYSLSIFLFLFELKTCV